VIEAYESRRWPDGKEPGGKGGGSVPPAVMPAAVPPGDEVRTADPGTDNSASYSPDRSQDDGPNSCADARTFERPCLGRDGHSQQGQRDNSSLNCSVHVGPLEFQRGSIKQRATSTRYPGAH